MSRRFALVVARLLPWLLLPSAAWAAKPAADEPKDDFAEVTLQSGLSVGWGMLRIGGDDEGPVPLEGNVVARANSVTRLIVDEASGATFGYRLEARALAGFSGPAMMAVSVDILPLEAADEKDLRRLKVCEGCPALRLVATSIRYPPRQIVREGDTIVIDLLERPKTAEKIVDLVKFSAETVTEELLSTLRGRVREASRHVRRGDELAARGAYEEAAAAYARAAPLHPDAGVHRRLGECHQRLGRADAAQREYETAVRLNPSDAEARHLLSVVRHRRGDVGKAASGYRHVLKLRPDWALARRNLATAQLDRGALAEAVQEYRQAHRSDPTILESKNAATVRAQNPALQLYVIAKVYMAERDTAGALDSLRRAFDAGFDDVQRVRQDPDFAPVLQDPRFVGLLARAARS